MGVEQTHTLNISCDNPSCPGNSLDPTSYEGWVQITATVQLPPVEHEGSVPFIAPVSQSGIFCSPECAGTIEQTLTEAKEARDAEATPAKKKSSKK